MSRAAESVPLPSLEELVLLFNHAMGCIPFLARAINDRAQLEARLQGSNSTELYESFVSSLDAARRSLVCLEGGLWAAVDRASPPTVRADDEESLLQALAQLYPPGTQIKIRQGKARDA